MPITIPDKTKIRFTTDFNENCGQRIPAVVYAATTNPGPMAVRSTQNAPSGLTQVVPAAGDAGREGYLGYALGHDVPAGENPSLVKGVIIEGFAGMTPGQAIFIDDTSADASGTASGLTHTVPTTGDILGRIGVALTATKLRID